MMGRNDSSGCSFLPLCTGICVRDAERHLYYTSYLLIKLMLMQPPQSLNNPPNTLNIHTPNQRHNLLLHMRIAAQKPLDQLAVHKPERLIRLAHQTAEGAELVEREVPQGVDVGGQRGLQTHEEILVVGVD